jgi:cytochrome c oxidase subunit 2
MDQGFRLFPESASTVAPHVDALFLFLNCVAAFFTLLIFVAIVFLALYYRRSAVRDRTRSRPASKVWILEYTWIGVPFALAMIMFGWGAKLYFELRTPPPSAIEIAVVAKQWMWKAQHPQGRSEINELHVPVGRPVRLRMISEDVIHSFFIPEFRTKMDVLPGTNYSTLWFEATRPGRFHLYCAEYCGTDHAKMAGRVTVMEPAAYAEWLVGAATQAESPPVVGEQLFARFRCQTCHDGPSPGRSPSLRGLFGSPVALADGRVVEADDNYIRESIVNPRAKVAAGFEPLMPTYSGQISEEEIFHLLAFIKSLSRNPVEGGTP